MIFKPAYEDKDDGIEHGVLSKFNPKTTILKAGTQLHPEVSPLKHDIKYFQDLGVKMRDGIIIYRYLFTSGFKTRRKSPCFNCLES